MIWLTLRGLVMKGDDHMVWMFLNFVSATRHPRRHSTPLRGTWRGVPLFPRSRLAAGVSSLRYFSVVPLLHAPWRVRPRRRYAFAAYHPGRHWHRRVPARVSERAWPVWRPAQLFLFAPGVRPFPVSRVR